MQLKSLEESHQISSSEGIPLEMVREMSILMSIRHPNIVAVREAVVDQSQMFMVMELVDFDLGLLIEHMKSPFSEPQVKCLAMQLLSARVREAAGSLGEAAACAEGDGTEGAAHVGDGAAHHVGECRVRDALAFMADAFPHHKWVAQGSAAANVFWGRTAEDLAWASSALLPLLDA